MNNIYVLQVDIDPQRYTRIFTAGAQEEPFRFASIVRKRVIIKLLVD